MNGIPAAPLQCDWLLAAGDWHAAVGALSRAGGGARTKTKGRGRRSRGRLMMTAGFSSGDGFRLSSRGPKG